MLETAPTITRTIDARGSFCPGPLMELIAAMKAAQVGDLGAAQPADLAAEHEHLAGRRPVEPGEEMEEGRLAASRRPHE